MDGKTGCSRAVAGAADRRAEVASTVRRRHPRRWLRRRPNDADHRHQGPRQERYLRLQCCLEGAHCALTRRRRFHQQGKVRRSTSGLPHRPWVCRRRHRRCLGQLRCQKLCQKRRLFPRARRQQAAPRDKVDADPAARDSWGQGAMIASTQDMANGVRWRFRSCEDLCSDMRVLLDMRTRQERGTSPGARARGARGGAPRVATWQSRHHVRRARVQCRHSRPCASDAVRNVARNNAA